MNNNSKLQKDEYLAWVYILHLQKSPVCSTVIATKR